VALHVEDELVLRRPDLHARELIVERRVLRQVEEAALRPAAAFAALKASRVLAAPHAEVRNFRLPKESFLEKAEANSWRGGLRRGWQAKAGRGRIRRSRCCRA